MKAAPKPPKSKRTWILSALAVAVPLSGALKKGAQFLLQKEPRLCPRCAYRMVTEVRRMTSPGGKRLAYWYCQSCTRRYKTVDAGPFFYADDDEWRARVG